MQQNRCPECNSPIRQIGQKWECTASPLHNVRARQGNNYSQSGSINTPFSFVSGKPNPNPAAQPLPQTVPLSYPDLRLPSENTTGLRHKITCPFCNYEFRLDQAAIVSTIHPGTVLRQPGEGGLLKKTFGNNILSGPEYATEMASYQCPNCLLTLPYRYESSTNISIGVIGDTFSGKTHYLAALLCQLEEGGMTQTTSTTAIRFTPQTDDTKNALKEYRDVLKNQEAFDNTRPFVAGRNGELPVRKPLIFSLIIQHTFMAQETRSVNLVFYDLSGEDIADDRRLSQFGWPVLKSHAFIYLADPLSMKEVRNRLPTNKKPNAQQLAIYEHRSSYGVLEQTIDIISRYRGLPRGGTLPFPIAIMLAKSDILDDVIPSAERQNATFLDQVKYDGLIHVEDLAHNHNAISDWLSTINEVRLRQVLLYIPNSSYFAASATGSSTNTMSRFTSIQPRRCLDPLLWILWRLAIGAY